VVYDMRAEAVRISCIKALRGVFARRARRPAEQPAGVWLMLPAAAVDPRWRSSHRYFKPATSCRRRQTPTTATHPAQRRVEARGIHHVDVGTSGGVAGWSAATA